MHGVSSTFADRLSSHGLLLLRLILAIALIARCVQFVNGASPQIVIPHVIAAGAGLFVLFGFWTSVAGAVVAIIELFLAFSHHHDPWLSVLLASVGVALTLLGPGNWSVDARRSGWKRIEIRRPGN
jgi:uncharacterized membrane protein YphA (DoxX/SURF4 family)